MVHTTPQTGSSRLVLLSCWAQCTDPHLNLSSLHVTLKLKVIVQSSGSRARCTFSLDPLPLPLSSPSHSNQIFICYFPEIDLIKVTSNFPVAKSRGSSPGSMLLFLNPFFTWLQRHESLFGFHLLCWVLLLCLTFKYCSALLWLNPRISLLLLSVTPSIQF